MECTTIEKDELARVCAEGLGRRGGDSSNVGLGVVHLMECTTVEKNAVGRVCAGGGALGDSGQVPALSPPVAARARVAWRQEGWVEAMSGVWRRGLDMARQVWLGVVSHDHVRQAVAGGFCRFDHGKPNTILKLRAGDRVVYYSPREKLSGGAVVQAFTALGEVLEGDVFYADGAAQRRVRYEKECLVPIRPLLEQLSFTSGHKSWGLALRRSSFRISEADYDLIAGARA